MAEFSEERASFRPWLLVAMVKMQDSWEKTVERVPDCCEESGPYVTGMGVARLAQADPHKQTLRRIPDGARWYARASVRLGYLQLEFEAKVVRGGAQWLVHENADSGSQGGVGS